MIDLLNDASFWVAVSFVIFILLIFNPLKTQLSKSLDNKVVELQKSIQDAKQLKKDAEIIYDEHLKKQKDTAEKIKRMKDDALREAKEIKEKFEKEIDISQKRKQKNFEQISMQVQLKANEEIKKEILEKAIKYTEQRIRKNLSSKHNKVLVEESLKKLSDHSFK